MEYVGIDLYTKESQTCPVAETGTVIEERKPHGTPNLLDGLGRPAGRRITR